MCKYQTPQNLLRFSSFKKNPLFFITKKYLITFDAFNENDKKNNIYTFYFYKIKFRKGTNQELIADIKTSEKRKHKKKINKSLVNYLNKYGHIKTRNYIATIISEEETCEGTMDFVLQHYQKSIEKYNKYNVYLFIQSGNKNEIKKLLSEKYKLYLNKYSNIIIDTTFTYSSYVNFKVNDIPRIIKVRDNRIVADTIFPLNNSGVINMQKFLINSGKEQKLNSVCP